jgi:hypothetical protein
VSVDAVLCGDRETVPPGSGSPGKTPLGARLFSVSSATEEWMALGSGDRDFRGGAGRRFGTEVFGPHIVVPQIDGVGPGGIELRGDPQAVIPPPIPNNMTTTHAQDR